MLIGFEPVDLLKGIYYAVRQLEAGIYKSENAYQRVVKEEGLPSAQKTIDQIFEVSDKDWRGIGTIPNSGYKITQAYIQYDAAEKFQIDIEKVEEPKECIAGTILKGIKKPFECPEFGNRCTPENPLGAPMVSSEGACAAYYHFNVTE